MSISDDSYDYNNYIYSTEWYEEYEGPPLIKKRSRLIAAVVQNNVDLLKDLLDSPKWREVRDKYGYTLLQIAVLRENREVFDYMLSIEDFPLETVNKEGETAVVVALSGFVSNDIWIREYFGVELIKKGAKINHLCFEDNTLLHCALERDYIEAAKLLIEKGVELNTQNEERNTPLQMCWYCNNTNFVEAVTMLLCYGADPWIRNEAGLTAFDSLILSRDDDVLQAKEFCFYWMFDQYTQYTIPDYVLLKAANTESSLFYRILDHISEVTFTDHINSCSIHLLGMKSQHLQLLIEKFYHVVEKILFENDGNLFYYNLKSISLENLNILAESNLKHEMINFFRNCSNNRLINFIIQHSNMSQDEVMKLICFLLSYGMNIYEMDLENIYKKFGYCELFKILLHMDVQRECGKTLQDPMVRLICDVNTDIQEFIETPRKCPEEDLHKLLHYCAHPKLQDFCNSTECGGDHNINLPQIPHLVELSRNVFRRYFIKRFHITSIKQFLKLLKLLPISIGHEMIITYETQLY